jgi:hypothetical protein
MKPVIPNRWAVLCLVSILLSQFAVAGEFEGRITAAFTRGGQVGTLLYTIGTNCLRIERGENDQPYPKNLFARDTGAVTLVFPNNRSFVKLKPRDPNAPNTPPGFPAPAQMPMAPGTPIQSPSGAVGPTNLAGMPVRPQMPALSQPAMPAMPPMPTEPMELRATKDTTNLLGYNCVRYELSLRGEAMELWATDKLPPFEPYVQNELRFGPRMIEDQWGQLLKAKKLFPLLAVLRFQPASPTAPGRERSRFEVKSVTSEKIEDATLFKPPPDYHELAPMPF